ncbi:MAG: type I-E CRISPR-associated protein Cse2/CasB [Ardenticatenaceae bacterium]|nr:type I-E CRISPR-associated protein Cse2/CasB [Ardenticatenaceae bacterium]
MDQSESQKEFFITYLEALRDSDDRGALAALRRGLGKRPGETPEMFRYVVPRLPTGLRPWEEICYYTVASLFAMHPQAGGSGNMGAHLAAIRAQNEGKSSSLEQRFTVLLSTHTDDLPNHLRQIVSLLKSYGVPVNWGQLLADIRSWDFPESATRTKNAWARAFWGYAAVNSPADLSSAHS